MTCGNDLPVKTSTWTLMTLTLLQLAYLKLTLLLICCNIAPKRQCPSPPPEHFITLPFSLSLPLCLSFILQKHVLSIMEAVIGLARIPRQGCAAVAQLDLRCSLMGKRAKVSLCLLCNASFAFSGSSTRCKYAVI